MYQHLKNKFTPSIRSLDVAMLESCVQGAQTQKFFDQLLIFINLNFFQHATNQAVSSFYSSDTVNFKILQSNWLITFYLVSGTRFFADTGLVQDNEK